MNYCQNTRKFLKIFCFIRNYNYFTLIQLQHHLQKNNNKDYMCSKLTIRRRFGGEQILYLCSSVSIAKFQHVIAGWVTKSMGIVKNASPFFKQHFRLR